MLDKSRKLGLLTKLQAQIDSIQARIDAQTDPDAIVRWTEYRDRQIAKKAIVEAL